MEGIMEKDSSLVRGAESEERENEGLLPDLAGFFINPDPRDPLTRRFPMSRAVFVPTGCSLRVEVRRHGVKKVLENRINALRAMDGDGSKTPFSRTAVSSLKDDIRRLEKMRSAERVGSRY